MSSSRVREKSWIWEECGRVVGLNPALDISTQQAKLFVDASSRLSQKLFQNKYYFVALLLFPKLDVQIFWDKTIQPRAIRLKYNIHWVITRTKIIIHQKILDRRQDSCHKRLFLTLCCLGKVRLSYLIWYLTKISDWLTKMFTMFNAMYIKCNYTINLAKHNTDTIMFVCVVFFLLGNVIWRQLKHAWWTFSCSTTTHRSPSTPSNTHSARFRGDRLLKSKLF